jgi:hypothetical protein
VLLRKEKDLDTVSVAQRSACAGADNISTSKMGYEAKQNPHVNNPAHVLCLIVTLIDQTLREEERTVMTYVMDCQRTEWISNVWNKTSAMQEARYYYLLSSLRMYSDHRLKPRNKREAGKASFVQQPDAGNMR